MKILLTVNQLHLMAGSELLTLELAEGLRENGHKVSIFTFFPGFLAKSARARDIGILTPTDRRAILRYQPDVIGASHWPTLAFLREIGVTAPAILSSLGVLPDLENPPRNSAPNLITWTVSEETSENLNRRLVVSRKIEVVRNWFPPGLDLNQEPRLASQIPRAKLEGLVVSNHLPRDYFEMLLAAADQAGVVLTKVGKPERSVKIDAKLLCKYDFVVSIGRTAIQAAALGLPVLLLDQSKLDGWISPTNVADLSTRNYSGRLYNIDPSIESLADLLRHPPSPTDLLAVKAYILENHSPKKCIGKVEQLLREAIEVDSREDFGLVSKSMGKLVNQFHSSRFALNWLLQRLRFWRTLNSGRRSREN